MKWERGKKIDISELARKHGCRHVETGRLLGWMKPDFYLPVGNDAMRIGLAYLKGERLEVWGKATLQMLEKAFKNTIGEFWE